MIKEIFRVTIPVTFASLFHSWISTSVKSITNLSLQIRHLIKHRFTFVYSTILRIPRSIAILEKPAFPQLIKKFTAIYGTRKLITVCSQETASCSCPQPYQASQRFPQTTFWWSIFVLSSHLHLGYPIGFFPSSNISPLPHKCHVSDTSYSSLCDHPQWPIMHQHEYKKIYLICNVPII